MRTHERFAQVGGWLTALALLCVGALAFASPSRETRRVRESRRMRGSAPSLPFFSAFSESGAGTSGACSTTAPTGAKGEVLTFTRASNGTCTKGSTGGLRTTGIADGDLVVLSTNVARVEYDSAGYLGLLVEAARTNYAQRSQELDNVYWTAGSAGVTAPSITADYATAPDGTLTAERVVFPACPAAGNYSDLYKTAIDAAAVHTASIYCRGTSADQTISLCAYGGATVATLCVPFTCRAASWTRMVVTTPSVAGTGMLMGCDNTSYTGSSNTGAADVLLWGADFESGAYATSYIPTAGVAVARAAESSYFTVSIPGPTYSIAASFETPVTVASSNVRVATLYQDATHWTDDYFPTRFTAYLYDGAADSKLHSASLTTSGRVASYFDGTNLGACINGACETAAAAATWTAWTRVRLGVDGGGGTAGHLNGIVTRVQADMAATRAR